MGYVSAFDVVVMDGLVDVEEEDLGLALHEPALGEVDGAPAVQEHEQSYFFIASGFLHSFFEFDVGGDGVDLILYVFRLEEGLGREGGTVNILRAQRESTSMAEKMTMET